jgi:hypothetical protein
MSEPSFYLDSGASDEIQLTMNLALSRLKMTTFLHVCFFAMMDEIDRLFWLCFFLDLLFERWILLAGVASTRWILLAGVASTRWNVVAQERLQSATLFRDQPLGFNDKTMMLLFPTRRGTYIMILPSVRDRWGHLLWMD